MCPPTSTLRALAGIRGTSTSAAPLWSLLLSIDLACDDSVTHVLRPDPVIELLRREEAELQGRVTEREILAVRFQRDLRGLLVADVRVECGHEHERIVQVLADA